MFRAIIGIAVLLWLCLNRKGKFKIVSSDSVGAVFRTNFGRFSIDYTRGVMAVSGPRHKEDIPFADIARLEINRTKNSAVLEEIAMGGLDLKHDFVEWHTIHFVLCDGRAVPVYAIGEYRIQVPWGQRFIEMERRFLSFIRLAKDGSKASSAVLEKIQGLFAGAGQSYPVTDHSGVTQAELANK